MGRARQLVTPFLARGAAPYAILQKKTFAYTHVVFFCLAHGLSLSRKIKSLLGFSTKKTIYHRVTTSLHLCLTTEISASTCQHSPAVKGGPFAALLLTLSSSSVRCSEAIFPSVNHVPLSCRDFSVVAVLKLLSSSLRFSVSSLTQCATFVKRKSLPGLTFLLFPATVQIDSAA